VNVGEKGGFGGLRISAKKRRKKRGVVTESSLLRRGRRPGKEKKRILYQLVRKKGKKVFSFHVRRRKEGGGVPWRGLRRRGYPKKRFIRILATRGKKKRNTIKRTISTLGKGKALYFETEKNSTYAY